MDKEFRDEYLNIPINTVQCRRCKQELNRIDLVVSFDIEYGHLLNKGKHANSPDLHATRFEACPFCGITLYADYKRLGN